MTTHTEPVSVVAVHCLSSGDKRFLQYMTNGNYPIAFSQYVVNQELEQQNTLMHIHIPESSYVYGSTFLVDQSTEDSHIYADLHQKGYKDHGIIHTQPIAPGHVGWSAVPIPDIGTHTEYHTKGRIMSGLLGLSRVLGIPDDVMFLWVSVERYESTVALICGNHIVRHNTIPVGTSLLVQSIVDVLNVDVPFARSVIEKHGLMHSHHDRSLREVLTNCLSPLVQIITETLEFAQNAPYRTAIERKPVQLWVCGGVGAVNIPGLAEYLGLSIPVPLYTNIHSYYQGLIQSSDTPITAKTLPKYYILLGLTALG